MERLLSLFILLPISFYSCSKTQAYTQNPSSDIIRPESYEHYWGLLNDEKLMAVSPYWGEESADDYWLQPSYFHALDAIDQQVYSWQKEIYTGTTRCADWDVSYSQILQCNLILEGAAHLLKDSPTVARLQYLKGHALFARSLSFYNLLQVFADAYDSTDAAQKPGIVLRKKTKDEQLIRSPIGQCYEQVLADLRQSLPLLPAYPDSSRLNLASRAAAYGLLARVYLSMRAYGKARSYADSCLAMPANLLDFAQLTSGKLPPPMLNQEILYKSWLIEHNPVIQANTGLCMIDTTLYDQYEASDLRKTLYFSSPPPNEKPWYKGSFAGNAFAFTGITTGEILLIRAECKARLKDISGAMADINHLLLHRYKRNQFTSIAATTADQALGIVLTERRKELVFRALRWTDIKRLNKEGAHIDLQRKLGQSKRQLVAGHKNFLLPIPPEAIYNTLIVQNPRE